MLIIQRICHNHIFCIAYVIAPKKRVIENT